MEIGLVSCTKSKRDQAANPADLYMKSAFFRKAREYGTLWERLVEEDLRLQDVIPFEHRVAIEVLRRLIGASEVADFRLPGPLARRTELGQRPSATQLSLDTATARV